MVFKILNDFLFPCGQNEEILKKCVTDYQGKLKDAEDRTEAVIRQAEDKLAK